jgi:hypothetical protein
MRCRRAADLEQRHLRAQRNALRPLQCEQGLDHQQPEHVLLVRHAGQQDARRPRTGRQGGHRLAEQTLGQLGEQMFLEHLELPSLPVFADLAGQRRHGVLDKTLQTLAGQALLHGLLVAGEYRAA